MDDVDGAMRVASLLFESGYQPCDLLFSCTDEKAHHELSSKGIPSVLSATRGAELPGANRKGSALSSGRAARHRCDDLLQNGGGARRTTLISAAPIQMAVAKCVESSEKLNLVVTLLRNGHSVCYIDVASVFLYQDPLLHINPLPQTLIAARDFSLFVARPGTSTGGITAQLFEKMQREFEAGYVGSNVCFFLFFFTAA